MSTSFVRTNRSLISYALLPRFESSHRSLRSLPLRLSLFSNPSFLGYLFFLAFTWSAQSLFNHPQFPTTTREQMKIFAREICSFDCWISSSVFLFRIRSESVTPAIYFWRTILHGKVKWMDKILLRTLTRRGEKGKEKNGRHIPFIYIKWLNLPRSFFFSGHFYVGDLKKIEKTLDIKMIYISHTKKWILIRNNLRYVKNDIILYELNIRSYIE